MSSTRTAPIRSSPLSEIAEATRLLREGQLIGLPTETVYGLAADAENDSATRRIFAVKGRPATHPLIVHLSDAAHLDEWVAAIPAHAHVLAAKFWPGPLTLIFQRGARASDIVTGGQNTIAIRIPRHPTAQALLRSFGGGIAAPSANRFGSVSPTTADHVRRDLGSDVALVLDGGPCDLGVESTIVDVSRGTPILMRPGSITKEEIERVLGMQLDIHTTDAEVRAPGQVESHYAPKARVVIVSSEEASAFRGKPSAEQLHTLLLDASGQSESLEVVAHSLYQSLRDADDQGATTVLVVLPKDEGLGRAVRDRLLRAAGPRKS